MVLTITTGVFAECRLWGCQSKLVHEDANVAPLNLITLNKTLAFSNLTISFMTKKIHIA
jgi:hypothetical protein